MRSDGIKRGFRPFRTFPDNLASSGMSTMWFSGSGLLNRRANNPLLFYIKHFFESLLPNVLSKIKNIFLDLIFCSFMSKDSQYSYVHMKQPHHIIFQEKWDVDRLPFDDIEINSTAYHGQDNILQEFLASAEDQDSDLNIINGANPMFNSSYANRMRQKHKKLNWKDLGLAELLSDKNHVHDQTILTRPQFGSSESQTASESPRERTEEQVMHETDIAGVEEHDAEEFATPIIPNRTIHQNLYSRQRKFRKPSTEYQTPQSHARIIR
ncbi:hypothetical protein KL931_005297 [Ogataea haglerorum]|nr:hypothetical protein KL931_005297 [Ogataea haglerorum]